MSRNQGDLGPTIYSISRLITLFHQEVASDQNNQFDHSFIETGFTQLDNAITGFQRGELVVIGSAPAMGKSAFVLSMIHHISSDNIKVRFFSLGINAQRVFEFLLQIHTEKNSREIDLFYNEKSLGFLLTVKELMEKKIIIDDDLFSDYIDLIDRIKHDQLFHKSSVFAIDHIQLLGRCGSSKKEMDLCLKAIKNIAVELNIVIIVLTRVSKSIKKRKKHIPKLSDLTELGKFEKYADFIGFIHRPEYYGFVTNKKGESRGGMMYLYIEKACGRMGKVRIPLKFLCEYGKVKNPYDLNTY